MSHGLRRLQLTQDHGDDEDYVGHTAFPCAWAPSPEHRRAPRAGLFRPAAGDTVPSGLEGPPSLRALRKSRRRSPSPGSGSNDCRIGCSVWWECRRAGWFFDESQPPMRPPLRHRCRRTEGSALSRRSRHAGGHLADFASRGHTLLALGRAGSRFAGAVGRPTGMARPIPQGAQETSPLYGCCPSSSRNFSTSRAAMHPEPAAVMAWR